MSEVKSYIGSGKVHLEDLNASKGLVEIGEVSKLELAIETDKRELKSNTSPGGGIADTVSRITGVNLSMDVSSLSPENIAMALYGDVSAVAGEAVTDEAHKANPGALVAFVNPPDLTQGITVTGSGGTPTYDEGADYELSPAGIKIKAGSAISANTDILVDYMSLGHDVVQMLTNSGGAYRLYFEGLNEANSDKPVLLDLYRCKFEPTSALGLIADDFASLSLSGSVLKDAAKAGAGISKFASIKMV